MPQNLAAQVAQEAGGGITFLQLDAAGNLRVAENESASYAQLNASSGNVAAGAAVATLAAAAGKTTYVAGISVTGGGATAASVILVTLAGLLGGTMTFGLPIPAGVNVGITPINLQFNPPLPASAVNTAIVLTAPSFGAGNTNAAVNAWGFQK